MTLYTKTVGMKFAKIYKILVTGPCCTCPNCLKPFIHSFKLHFFEAQFEALPVEISSYKLVCKLFVRNNAVNMGQFLRNSEDF